MSRARVLSFMRVAVSIWLACIAVPAAAQQDIGHKILGGIGVDAGAQSEPGLYLATRLVWYASTELRDRFGDAVPVQGFDVGAWGGTLGVAYVIKPAGGPYLSFAFSAPVAKLSLSVDDPRAAIDRSGFGDMYVQPMKAGWRWRRFDAVISYALYVPTGRFEPRGGSGIGRGFWTHELSLGGEAYISDDRTRRISVLASYDDNSRKRGIDITRGNTVQVQGGAAIGGTKAATVGVAGYALWQVTDDKGSALPPVLRGARDQVFGIGPEVQVALPKIGARAELRLLFEFGARARPEASVLAGGLTYRTWPPPTSGR
jgi:hypothetical protein